MAVQYFSNLFTADDSVVPDEIVNLFEAKVTDEMNSSLCKDLSAEEISNALFQIGPLKAPGPNGYSARFFPEELGAGTGKGDFRRDGILQNRGHARTCE